MRRRACGRAQVEGLAGLAQHTGAPTDVLGAELEAYNRAKEQGGPDALGKIVFPAGTCTGRQERRRRRGRRGRRSWRKLCSHAARHVQPARP